MNKSIYIIESNMNPIKKTFILFYHKRELRYFILFTSIKLRSKYSYITLDYSTSLTSIMAI